ncbi:MAG: hypothetical protein GXP39_08595 [Chloroflexi bacterium]|nr:hypothetical protein [Chloroflexota bacterium]
MVEFRKLDKETTAALFEKPKRSKVAEERARIREEYKQYLSQLEVGEGGELVLGENEKKVTVRNRLNRAAKELGITLEYKRTRDPVVRFRVVSK